MKAVVDEQCVSFNAQRQSMSTVLYAMPLCWSLEEEVSEFWLGTLPYHNLASTSAPLCPLHFIISHSSSARSTRSKRGAKPLKCACRSCKPADKLQAEASAYMPCAIPEPNLSPTAPHVVTNFVPGGHDCLRTLRRGAAAATRG